MNKLTTVLHSSAGCCISMIYWNSSQANTELTKMELVSHRDKDRPPCHQQTISCLCSLTPWPLTECYCICFTSQWSGEMLDKHWVISGKLIQTCQYQPLVCGAVAVNTGCSKIYRIFGWSQWGQNVCLSVYFHSDKAVSSLTVWL